MRTFGSTFNFKLKTRANLLALFLPCAVPFLILVYISCKKNVYLPDLFVWCTSCTSVLLVTLWYFLYPHCSHSPSSTSTEFFKSIGFRYEREHTVFIWGWFILLTTRNPGSINFLANDDFFHDKAMLCFCLPMCMCVPLGLWMWVAMHVALHFLYPFIHNLADFTLGCCRYYCNKHGHGSLLNSSWIFGF